MVLFPVDWENVVGWIRELQTSLAARTLIINDAFAMPESLLVEACLTYIVNYGLQIHFHHYHRLGTLPVGYTPSKGKTLYQEEVPEWLVSVARHVCRPRLLSDHALALPNLTIEYPNGVRYGGLAAGTAQTVLRNNVLAGAADPVLARINIAGSAFAYRPRVFLSFHRVFDGMKFVKLEGREGLVPAKLAYWRDTLDRFVHRFDLANEFEKSVFELDTLLRHIVIGDFPADEDPPDGKRPDVDTAEWDAQFVEWTLSQFPTAIQWMAGNMLLGHTSRIAKSEFLTMEATCFFSHPELTVAYKQRKFFAEMKIDLSQFDFPVLGTVDEITELRVLVNEYGQGPPKGSSNASNARRYRRQEEKKGARQLAGAARQLATVGQVEPQPELKSNGAATSEESKTGTPSSDADVLSERQTPQHGRGRRRRRGPRE